MSTAIPPWPPDNFQAAQPYDQRGACWPWGPCPPSAKLPMRFDCIGSRVGGPVSPLWEGMADGVLAVVLPEDSKRNLWLGVLRINVPPLPSAALSIRPTNEPGIWYAELGYWLYTIEPAFAFIEAAGSLGESACGSDFILPVHTAFGLPSAPQFVTCTCVNWWEESEYEFNV